MTAYLAGERRCTIGKTAQSARVATSRHPTVSVATVWEIHMQARTRRRRECAAFDANDMFGDTLTGPDVGAPDPPSLWRWSRRCRWVARPSSQYLLWKRQVVCRVDVRVASGRNPGEPQLRHGTSGIRSAWQICTPLSVLALGASYTEFGRFIIKLDRL